jgi:hypothetical protein
VSSSSTVPSDPASGLIVAHPNVAKRILLASLFVLTGFIGIVFAATSRGMFLAVSEGSGRLQLPLSCSYCRYHDLKADRGFRVRYYVESPGAR